MSSKTYCGAGKTPKGKVLGTEDQCKKKGQLRLYGVNKIEKKPEPKKPAKKPAAKKPAAKKPTKKLDIKIKEAKTPKSGKLTTPPLPYTPRELAAAENKFQRARNKGNLNDLKDDKKTLDIIIHHLEKKKRENRSYLNRDDTDWLRSAKVLRGVCAEDSKREIKKLYGPSPSKGGAKVKPLKHYINMMYDIFVTKTKGSGTGVIPRNYYDQPVFIYKGMLDHCKNDKEYKDVKEYVDDIINGKIYSADVRKQLDIEKLKKVLAAM